MGFWSSVSKKNVDAFAKVANGISEMSSVNENKTVNSKKQNDSNTANKKSKILDDILSSLPPDISRYTKKKLTEVIDYEPRIGVMGKTGVGKSSLCNAIFQQEICKVSHVEACTREVEELPIDVGGRNLILIDLPGVGESEERDIEYKTLYEEIIPTLDLILWVIKADDRALGPDESFYKNVIKPLKAEDRILFVLNQADNIHPKKEWDDFNNRPSAAQIGNLERKEIDVYNRLFENNNGCVAVSAELKYNISNLVKKMVLRLPKHSKAAVYSNLREENKTEEVKQESKKGFTEAIKDVLDSVIDNAPVPKIVREPLKKVKDYVVDKISSFFDSWF